MSRFLTGLFAALALLISGVPAAAQSIGYSPNTLPLSGSCGVVTVSTPCLDLTQTWNNVATAFTGLKFNVTNTASAAGSLMDLQVGGVSQFKVDKAGIVDAAGRFVAPFYYVNSDTGAIFFGASLDTAIQRDGAANTLALRNGTAAQAFNIYNTYTDASNYERGYSRWNAGVFEFGMETAGTGTTKHTRINRASGANLYLGDWFNNSSGHFLANTDNTYDIGASGANRPRNIFVAGLGSFANYVAAAGIYPGGSLRSYINSGSDGTISLSNNAGSNSVQLTIGASNLLSLNGGLTLVGQLTPGGISPAATGTSISVGNAGFLQFGSGSGGAVRGFLDAPSDGSFRLHNGGDTNSVTMTVGASNLLTLNGGLKTTGATFALQTATTLTDNAAAQVATMTNGPTAGNPTKWIAINDNGTTRYIPAW